LKWNRTRRRDHDRVQMLVGNRFVEIRFDLHLRVKALYNCFRRFTS
jgi:hypothetical protein